MWQCGCLGGFGRWVDGCVTPSHPPNSPSHPQTRTHTATRWHLNTNECVCAHEFWCMCSHMCECVSEITYQAPATSLHPPMHTETPIHPSIDPASPTHWPIHLGRGGHSDGSNWNKRRIQTKSLSENFQLLTERWTKDLSFGVFQMLLLLFLRKLWASQSNTTYLTAPTVVFQI